METTQNNSSTVLNKILIPVITTVLGATAIYFLGFNKRPGHDRTDMEQMLLSKEATVKAWTSFVATHNISYSNGKSIGDQFAKKTEQASKEGVESLVAVWKEFQDEFLRESKKFTNDVEQILKEKDIDRDFVSMLNRTLDNQKDADKKLGSFFDKLTSVLRSDRDAEDKQQRLQAELTRYTEDSKTDAERMVTEAEGISKILMNKYSQAFNLNDLQVYVDYKKEKDKKATEPLVKTTGGPGPVDPTNAGGGTEVKTNNPPPDNGGSSGSKTTDYSSSNTNNTVEPTESLLTGNWSMTGGELELSDNGEMFWSFGARGYTSGDWKLEGGKLRMNATNPDTRITSLLIGYLSNVTRNSFTVTFMTSPKEVYHLKKKSY